MLRPGMRTNQVRFPILNMSQHVATVQGDQTRATCCDQQCWNLLRSNIVIVWLELANAEQTMLSYVVLRCYDRLAGLLLEEYTED